MKTYQMKSCHKADWWKLGMRISTVWEKKGKKFLIGQVVTNTWMLAGRVVAAEKSIKGGTFFNCKFLEEYKIILR